MQAVSEGRGTVKMAEMHEPNALRAAEPWLRANAERLMRRLYGEDFDPEADTEMLDRVLWELKRSYVEGYADRLKDEAKEAKSPEPKRRVQRRKK